MNKDIKVMAQSSNFVKWTKENQLMEPMYVARERDINILNYIDFSKICDEIKYFNEFFFGKEDITYSISSSSRAIE